MYDKNDSGFEDDYSKPKRAHNSSFSTRTIFDQLFSLSKSGSYGACALPTFHSLKSSSRSETSDIGALEPTHHVILDKYAKTINISEESAFLNVSDHAEPTSLLSEYNIPSSNDGSRSPSEFDSLATDIKEISSICHQCIAQR